MHGGDHTLVAGVALKGGGVHLRNHIALLFHPADVDVGRLIGILHPGADLNAEGIADGLELHVCQHDRPLGAAAHGLHDRGGFLTSCNTDPTQIEGSFSHARVALADGVHAVLQCSHQIDDLCGALGGQHGLGQISRSVSEAITGLGAVKLLAEVVDDLVQGRFEGVLVLGGEGKGCAGQGRNGGHAGAAGEGGQLYVDALVFRPGQAIVHSLDGVGTVLLDVHAGMSALESAQIDGVGDLFSIRCFALQRHVEHVSCESTGGHGAGGVVLGVDVDHVLGVCNPAVIHVAYAGGLAALFVDGDDHAQRAVHIVGGGGQEHRGGDADAVIAAQAGVAVRAHDALLVFFHHDDRRLGHVAAIIGDHDHVHVCLKHGQGHILIALGGRNIPADVSNLVLHGLEAVLLAPALQIVADGVGVPGAAGCSGNRREFIDDVAEHGFIVQLCQSSHRQHGQHHTNGKYNSQKLFHRSSPSISSLASAPTALRKSTEANGFGYCSTSR